MNYEEFEPSRIFPNLRLGRYRFVIKPRGPIVLPAYQGSTWRGLIGNALIDVVCPWNKKACSTCPNRESCAYHYLYEAGLNEKAFADPPRPYIFSVAETNGLELSVDMTLIGDAANFLPHLIAAWVRAGERGAGKGRCRFDLCVVDRFLPDGNMDRIYDSGKVINYEPVALPLADYFNGNPLAPPWTIAIKTPLRFRLKGKNAQIMDWGEAFKALAIRLSVMGQQYAGGSRLSKLAWDELMHFLKAPGAIENETHWYDWKRFSSSQRTHVYMGGLVGRSTVLPSRATPVWWQWWKAAELFHLGKATCMGLGSIKILN